MTFSKTYDDILNSLKPLLKNVKLKILFILHDKKEMPQKQFTVESIIVSYLNFDIHS